MNKLENLLKGFSQDKIAAAMRKAEGLSKNKDIQNAFAGVSKEELLKMFAHLDTSNKDKILNTILRSDNKGIVELLKKLKG